MKQFYVITIFPDIIDSYVKESIIGRAIKAKKLAVKAVNPRDFSRDKHHKTDHRPYAGGPGMVMTAEPILRAVEKIERTLSPRQLPGAKKEGESLSQTNVRKRTEIIILSPSGKQFTNREAIKLAKSKKDLIFIAGRYEGIDARVKKILKAKEYSIGPYVLTGGELPALSMIDAITRQVPGVLGAEESLEEKRVSSSEMYTRPEVLIWKNKKYPVPKVLLSGDHKKIDEWKRKSQGPVDNVDRGRG
ncbi:MAG: tRNA (guanosine(37)-N1)-methyltransferase TrmD [Candidatus Vogelbacteria bacterium]|nr:tRNA (guanosine(37)-N1)-methyltransferase TrmD [Candidatus Vogelbacteria bacterium]